MKSRAAIGNHPIHPALVPLPIGAFFLLLVGDIAHASTGADFWYHFGDACLSVGILAALVAALFGFIDYFKVNMSMSGFRIARIHMILNLTGVVLYAFNWYLRRNNGALHTDRWNLAFGLEVVTFLALGISGWLGGKLAFEHKVGVVENADPEATEIGRRETSHQGGGAG
ncbi:MAG: DUF2231 domain-containing protein [Thermoanaerobaculia bacterium]